MSSPSAPPPASRSEWLGARAALAGQRSARFAVATVAAFVVVLAVLFFIPRGSASREASAPLARPDTASLRMRSDSAHRAAADADSQYAATVAAAAHSAGQRIGLNSGQRSKHDSLQLLASGLDSLLARAANAPLPESYRALAGAIALHGDSRTARLVDSLDALDKRRAALAPTGGTDLPYAELTEKMKAVGAAIRDAATRRRGALARSIAEVDSAAHGIAAPADTAAPRLLRDQARRRGGD